MSTKVSDLVTLDQYNLANIFDVAKDSDGNYGFCVNKSVYVLDPDMMYSTYYTYYSVVTNDTWSLISYKVYGTIELWWLVCKVNQIVDATVSPTPGDVLRVLTTDVAQGIVNSMQNVGNVIDG